MADADEGLARDTGHCHGRPHCKPHPPKPRDGKEQSPREALAPVSRQQTARKHQHQQPQRRNGRPGDTSRHSAVPPTPPVPNIVVAGKYRLLCRIGQGSFGELYRAEGLKYGELVAIKLERAAVKHPLLAREARIYGILQGGSGIPRMRHYGTEGEFNVMVMDLLGPTLEDMLNLCSRTFSMKTILMLADQMLDRLEYLHLKCFVHRDIKPDNFLMGRGRHSSKVFMIDFGLAKKFYSKSSQQHIEYTENKELVGTARYASFRAHYAEQGRRDDLESVGYLLIYFRRGRLPWQGIRAGSETQKYERIAEAKASVPLDVLCSGLPMEFLLYLKYCRNLHFQQKPDYTFLRELFKTVFRNQYKRIDHQYDWDLKRHKQVEYHKHGGSRGQRTREGNRNLETDRDRNRKVDRDRKDLMGKVHPERAEDREPERNETNDRTGPKNREQGCTGCTHRERARDRDRERDPGRERDPCRERCQRRDRQGCSCQRHLKHNRDRDRPVGQATERARNVPEEPPSSHRQPQPGL